MTTPRTNALFTVKNIGPATKDNVTITDLYNEFVKLERELAEARAENEKFKADVARYRWLRDCSIGVDVLYARVIVWYGTDPTRKKIAQTLDAAIDAAMKENKP